MVAALVGVVLNTVQVTVFIYIDTSVAMALHYISTAKYGHCCTSGFKTSSTSKFNASVKTKATYG